MKGDDGLNKTENKLHITSEIGVLKKVLLHRPGKEIEHVIPSNMERLLFDDIPFLPKMQKEHDFFATELGKRNVEVVYLESLVKESITSQEVKLKLIDTFLRESTDHLRGRYELVNEYLESLPDEELVRKLMEGVVKNELGDRKEVHLNDFLSTSYPFYIDPLPNLYFTRDPATIIGDGMNIHKMCTEARKRESLFWEFIIKYHPDYKEQEYSHWYKRSYPFAIEGGDILILSEEVVAIGVSERTSAQAIEDMAYNLLGHSSTYKKVLAVEIPKKRAFMHLDTVFTMVDHDKFTIHPEIEGTNGQMNVFILELTNQKELHISKRSNLLDALKEVLKLTELALIPCGGGDEIIAPREQWNDGSNTLAIAPGVVVTYDRNLVTNKLLADYGLEVIEIPSSELSRGRGGPRCMSMPLVRE